MNVVDVHRSVLQSIRERGDFAQCSRTIRDAHDRKDTRLFRQLPGILVDVYCRARLSSRPSVHAVVLDAFSSAVAATSAGKRPTEAGVHALTRLLVAISECTPKSDAASTSTADRDELESLMLTFSSSSLDDVRRPFEAAIAADVEIDYGNLRKMRLLDDLVDRRSRTAVDLACEIAATLKAKQRPALYSLLESRSDDYVAMTSEVLLHSKRMPNFQDSNGAKKVHPSPAKRNLIRACVQQLVNRDEDRPKRNMLRSKVAIAMINRMKTRMREILGETPLETRTKEVKILGKKAEEKLAKTTEMNERMSYLFDLDF